MASLGDLPRAEELLARSLSEAAACPYWFRLHLGLLRVARGDLAGAAQVINEVGTSVDPLVSLVRAALACRVGQLAEAGEWADEAARVWPGIRDYGEIMLRRCMPENVVDALAAAVDPLGLGWFEDHPAGGATLS